MAESTVATVAPPSDVMEPGLPSRWAALRWLLTGAALVAAAIGWLIAFAPPAIEDTALGGWIVAPEAAVWSGSFVMPVMVSAAVVAAGVASFLARRPGEPGRRAGAATMVAGVAFGLTSVAGMISYVAYGEFATIGADRIFGTPVVPHAITTWLLVVVLAASALVAVVVRAPSTAVRTLAWALVLAGYVASATEFARHVDGVPAAGVVILIAGSGLWLLLPLWPGRTTH